MSNAAIVDALADVGPTESVELSREARESAAFMAAVSALRKLRILTNDRTCARALYEALR